MTAVHFVIMSYYELRESLLAAADALVSVGSAVFSRVTIGSYPLMQVKNELNHNSEEIINNFHVFWSAMDTHGADLIVVLWWYFGISADLMSALMFASTTKTQNVKHCLYNWDDPFVWTHEHHEMPAKSKLFDIVFVSSEASLSWYTKHGARQAVYVLPGFDPNQHYPSETEDYNVDVSICCTNLYVSETEFPDQLKPSRHEIVLSLVAQKKYTFAVYGPESLRAIVGDECYKGCINYANTRNVFTKSRINICTHVVGGAQGYLSERVSLILASGGLLWMDKVPQSLITEDHAYFIDPNVDIMTQISQILEDTEGSKNKKLAGYALAMSCLTWNHWATKIIENVAQFVDTKSLGGSQYALAWMRKNMQTAAFCRPPPVAVVVAPIKTHHDEETKKQSLSSRQVDYMVTKLSAPARRKIDDLVALDTLQNKEMVYCSLEKQK